MAAVAASTLYEVANVIHAHALAPLLRTHFDWFLHQRGERLLEQTRDALRRVITDDDQNKVLVVTAETLCLHAQVQPTDLYYRDLGDIIDVPVVDGLKSSIGAACGKVLWSKIHDHWSDRTQPCATLRGVNEIMQEVAAKGFISKALARQWQGMTDHCVGVELYTRTHRHLIQAMLGVTQTNADESPCLPALALVPASPLDLDTCEL